MLKVENTLAKPERTNWDISTRSQSRGLYALALVNPKLISTANVISQSTGGLAIEAKKSRYANEFIFNVNPKAIDLEEPAAVSITPTQDGSQFIEHQGSIYKTVSISGTTGLRPNAKNTIIPIINLPNPLATILEDPTTGLQIGETSGFDDLIELRNLFRRYFDLKRDIRNSHQTLMIWQNGKEGEFFIVEPQSFKTKRDSSHPLTFYYEIQLRTIRKLDWRFFAAPWDWRSIFTSVQRISQRLVAITRIVALQIAVIRLITDGKAAGNVGFALAQKILGPATSVVNNLTAVMTGVNQYLNTPRSSLKDIVYACEDFWKSMKTLAGEDAYTTSGISTPNSTLLHSVKLIRTQMTSAYIEDSLFSSPTPTKYTDRSKAYIDQGAGWTPPMTGGSPTALQNIRAPGGTAIATVAINDTIYSAAQRLLGDSARWKEIVIINNLKPPYISSIGDGVSVLRPGDRILFPTTGSLGPSGVVNTTEEFDDKLVKRLGRDIKLNALSDGTYDLEIDTRGDIARIEGVPNLTQAVKIKFSTEQGELPTHSYFGISAPIGRKVFIRSMVEFQLNLRSSILSDSRIGNINNLQIKAEENTLNIKSDLDIADVDQSVEVSFAAIR